MCNVDYTQPDKAQHYRIGYRFARFGSLVGFLVIIPIGAAKELWDYFRPSHKCEWLDFVAVVQGAWDGLIWRKSKV
jgi:hypothetical protein